MRISAVLFASRRGALAAALTSALIAAPAHAERPPGPTGPTGPTWPAGALPAREVGPDLGCADRLLIGTDCQELPAATTAAIQDSLRADLFDEGRGLVDPFGPTLYLRDALGHTVAVDAPTGRTRWRTVGPARALLATEDGLVLLTPDALLLVAKVDGRPLKTLAPSTIPLPATDAAAVRLDVRAWRAGRDTSRVHVFWTETSSPNGGIPRPPTRRAGLLEVPLDGSASSSRSLTTAESEAYERAIVAVVSRHCHVDPQAPHTVSCDVRALETDAADLCGGYAQAATLGDTRYVLCTKTTYEQTSMATSSRSVLTLHARGLAAGKSRWTLDLGTVRETRGLVP